MMLNRIIVSCISLVTILALLRSLAEYSRSMGPNAMEEAARAAAISAETSEPGNYLLSA